LLEKEEQKKTYGIETNEIFDPEVHDKSLAIRKNGVWYVEKVFETFIRYGDTVDIDEIVDKRFDVPPKCSELVINIYNCVDKDIPSFTTDDLVTKIGEISIDIDLNDLSNIPRYIDVSMKVGSHNLMVKAKDDCGRDQDVTVEFTSRY